MLLLLLPPPGTALSKVVFSCFALEADFGTAFRYPFLAK
jgi:hypothetical protein